MGWLRIDRPSRDQSEVLLDSYRKLSRTVGGSRKIRGSTPPVWAEFLVVRNLRSPRQCPHCHRLALSFSGSVMLRTHFDCLHRLNLEFQKKFWSFEFWGRKPRKPLVRPRKSRREPNPLNAPHILLLWGVARPFLNAYLVQIITCGV